MFTDPELARVGLNESEAEARGVNYRLATMPMAAVLRTRTLSEPRGFTRMLIDTDSDRILGFTVLGAEGGELMATVQTAMRGQLPFTVLRDALYTHPTAAEGLTVLDRIGFRSTAGRARSRIFSHMPHLSATWSAIRSRR